MTTIPIVAAWAPRGSSRDNRALSRVLGLRCPCPALLRQQPWRLMALNATPDSRRLALDHHGQVRCRRRRRLTRLRSIGAPCPEHVGLHPRERPDAPWGFSLEAILPSLKLCHAPALPCSAACSGSESLCTTIPWDNPRDAPWMMISQKPDGFPIGSWRKSVGHAERAPSGSPVTITGRRAGGMTEQSGWPSQCRS